MFICMIYGAKAPLKFYPALRPEGPGQFILNSIQWLFRCFIFLTSLSLYKGPEGPGNSFYSLNRNLVFCFYFHTSLRFSSKGPEGQAIHLNSI